MNKEYMLQVLSDRIESMYKEYCASCADAAVTSITNPSQVVKRSRIKNRILTLILIKELVEQLPKNYIMDNSDAELAFDMLVKESKR